MYAPAWFHNAHAINARVLRRAQLMNLVAGATNSNGIRNLATALVLCDVRYPIPKLGNYNVLHSIAILVIIII